MAYLTHEEKVRKRIKNSLCELLCEKRFSKITINDITERAEISKPTFYKYYADVYELLERIILSTQDEFYNEYSNLPAGTFGNLTKAIIFLREKQWVRECLLCDRSKAIFFEIINNTIRENMKNYYKDLDYSTSEDRFILSCVNEMMTNAIIYYIINSDIPIPNLEKYMFGILKSIRENSKYL